MNLRENVQKKPDFGSTTQVIAYVRRRVTPTVLWSAIGALITALVVAITWLVGTQTDIRGLKEAVVESKKSVAELRQELELLHKIDTQIAVMGSKVDDIAIEVNRQREWRDRIEQVADSPPHARRK